MCKLNFTLFAFLVLGGAHAALAGPISVLVNTNSIFGTSGSIDFQFNPGSLSSTSANVSIHTVTDGSYGGTQQDFGGASGGPVTSIITINNSSADNEDFETFTFGHSLLVTINFGGAAITSPTGLSHSGSGFFLSLFSDAAGTIPVLTNDPNGVVASVAVNDDGTLSPQTVSAQASLVPEPSTLMLTGGALIGLGMLRMRRCRA
jgi:hypothetical protein